MSRSIHKEEISVSVSTDIFDLAMKWSTPINKKILFYTCQLFNIAGGTIEHDNFNSLHLTPIKD